MFDKIDRWKTEEKEIQEQFNLKLKTAEIDEYRSKNKSYDDDHNQFVKNFIGDYYNKDDFPVELTKVEKKERKELEKFLDTVRTNLGIDSENSKLILSLYAELIWYLKNESRILEDCYYDNYDFFAVNRIIRAICANYYHKDNDGDIESFFKKESEQNGISHANIGRIYAKFRNSSTEFVKIQSSLQFIKYIYNPRIFSIIVNAAFTPFIEVQTLRKSNSERKFELALYNINICEKRLDDLLSYYNNDSLIKIIASAIKELVIEPTKQAINTDTDFSNLKDKKSSPEKNLKYDGKINQYVPFNKPGNSGGNGTVCTYWDTLKNRKVAIKVNKDKSDFGEQSINKLIDKVDSPYIAKMYELIKFPDGTQGLVMEYVHGHSIFSNALRNTKRFKKSDVIRICEQLVDAFKTFADAGFIHRDLDNHTKNITIDKNGNVKIIDYDNASYENRPGEAVDENTKEAIRFIILALDCSYPTLCEQFLRAHKYVTFDGTNYSWWSIKEHTEFDLDTKLPTFDQLKADLEELKLTLQDSE